MQLDIALMIASHFRVRCTDSDDSAGPAGGATVTEGHAAAARAAIVMAWPAPAGHGQSDDRTAIYLMYLIL